MRSRIGFSLTNTVLIFKFFQDVVCPHLLPGLKLIHELGTFAACHHLPSPHMPVTLYQILSNEKGKTPQKTYQKHNVTVGDKRTT